MLRLIKDYLIPPSRSTKSMSLVSAWGVSFPRSIYTVLICCTLGVKPYK